MSKVRNFAIASLIILIIFLTYFMFFSNRFDLFSFKEDEKIYQKIKVSYELEDYQKALNLIEDFLSEYSQSSFKNKVSITAANIFYQKKDYEKAKYYAEKAVSLSDNNIDYIDSVIILGKIYKDLEFFEPVVMNYLEDAYLKADNINKSEIAVYLGYEYLFKKDYINSIRYFNSTSGELSIIGRARVYIEQGKYPETIQEYNNYFSLYPKSEKIENIKTVFFKQSMFYAEQLKKAGLYEKAVQYYLNISDRFPRDNAADSVFINIAEVYRIQKNYEKALYYVDKVLANSVTACNEEAIFDKASIFYEMGKKTESLKLFQEIISKYPTGFFSKKAEEWIDVISKDINS